MTDTIVVNIFGAPGAGKSTGAAYIFSRLKMLGVDCELVTEFAKDKVWEENPTPFLNQMYMFAKQYYRVARVDGKVRVIITDSPLPLSIHYNKDKRLTENFNLTVMDIFNSFNNVCYFLKRAKSYNPNGRHQTEEESDAMSKDIFEMLTNYGVSFSTLYGTESGYESIVTDIYEMVKKDDVAK